MHTSTSHCAHSTITTTRVGQVAFAAVVDHTRQALVITCRGTLSVNDTITDGLAGEAAVCPSTRSSSPHTHPQSLTPMPLHRRAEEVNIKNDPEGKSLTLPEGHCAAHKGMWMSAKFLAAELRDAGVLRSVQRPSGGGAGEEKAEVCAVPRLSSPSSPSRLSHSTVHVSWFVYLPVAPEAPLVGTHRRWLAPCHCRPLAGCWRGNAALAAPKGSVPPPPPRNVHAASAHTHTLRAQTEYPELECYAFSPPGALVSPSLASFMEEWLVSIVLGKDLVPRLSVPALHKLLLHMVPAASSAA